MMRLRRQPALLIIFLALLLPAAVQAQDSIFVAPGGNVGIGTSNPDVELHVGKGQSGRNEIRIESSDFGPPVIGFQSLARHYEFQADTVGNWLIRDVTSNTVPFVIEPGTPSNVLRLDNHGRLGINTISPQAALDVVGGIGLSTLGTAGSTPVCRNASNQLSTCSSSIRYKKMIDPVQEDVRAFVNDVTPVTFSWKSAYSQLPVDERPDRAAATTADPSTTPGTNDYQRRHLGFIAEQVHAAAQKHGSTGAEVTFDNTAGQVEGIDLGALVAVLWRNVQQLNTENEQLKARLAALESQQRRSQPGSR